MSDTQTQQTPNVIFNLKYDPYSKTRNPFVTCKENGRKRNIVDYVNDGAKESMNIVDYTGNKEKSAGAFDRKGLMTDERLERTKEMLRKTHSVIWRGIVSFEGEFGDFHMRCFEDAYSLMKTQFPKFIKAAGLDYGNVVWFAAMHRNTLNRHIHLTFFERRGTHERKGKKVLCYSKGKLPPEAFAEFKFNMESYLSGEWRDVVAARDKISFKGDEGRKMYDKFCSNQLQKKIHKLSLLLPKEGRLSYNSANMGALIPLVREIADDIIRSTKETQKAYYDFGDALWKRDEAAKRISPIYGLSPESYALKETVMEDFYARLGNQIIKYALRYRDDVDGIEAKRSGRIATKHIKRRRTNELFKGTLGLAAALRFESQNYFLDYINKLKQFERMELQRQHQKQNEMEID